MARVSATVSARLMPLKNTAIAKAAAWPSVIRPAVRPSTKNAISLGVERAAVALAADDLLRQHAAILAERR